MTMHAPVMGIVKLVIIYSDDFFQVLNFYEYISSPKCYIDLLNDFWNKVLRFQINDLEEGPAPGELYYLNNSIKE